MEVAGTREIWTYDMKKMSVINGTRLCEYSYYKLEGVFFGEENSVICHQ